MAVEAPSTKEPPIRILVVEDDALVGAFAVEVLRAQGYNVMHAANGEAGVARMAADQ
jgi:DNA-binding response OmpR family regulator